MSVNRVLLGLIGANIMGSLSPPLFADAFKSAGVDGYYHLMDVDRLPGRRLPQLLDAMKMVGFTGANVTYPFKQEILPLLDKVDLEAAQVGAINTVAIAPDGRTTGYNFDRRGWRRSFEESLGAGAALGATVVHDRDAARAQALCNSLANHFGAARCRVAMDLEREIAAAGGVVNATQTGMRGFPGNPVPVSALTSVHWAADVIYTPVDTEFIKAAAAKGCRILSGSGMCVHQAVEAFRLFTGITPDVAKLHRVFKAAYEAREAAFVAVS
jgi:shikimate dehydrogenase